MANELGPIPQPGWIVVYNPDAPGEVRRITDDSWVALGDGPDFWDCAIELIELGGGQYYASLPTGLDASRRYQFAMYASGVSSFYDLNDLYHYEPEVIRADTRDGEPIASQSDLSSAVDAAVDDLEQQIDDVGDAVTDVSDQIAAIPTNPLTLAGLQGELNTRGATAVFFSEVYGDVNTIGVATAATNARVLLALPAAAPDTGGGLYLVGGTNLPMVQVYLSPVQAEVANNSYRCSGGETPISNPLVQGETRVLTFTVTDAAGTPIDLTGHTLRFLVTDQTVTIGKFEIESGVNLSVTGDDGNVVLVTINGSVTAAIVDDKARYELWDLTANQQLARGACPIRRAMKDVE